MNFENTEVFGIEHALRGMRNPLNSWEKSDSYWGGVDWGGVENKSPINLNDSRMIYIIGSNDIDLAQKLIKAGSEHRKFLRQIFVSVDITAPRYFWTEFDTYKVGTTSNSCSTMHTLMKDPITKEMFECDPHNTFDEENWKFIIGYLEGMRLSYLMTKDYTYFRKLKQALPESFLQKRTCTMNYEVILNMINQRKNHRLKEWAKDFIEWTKKLPYAKELLFIEKSN